MNIDDSKLDKLLRDVEIPVDLKPRLRKIPKEATIETVPRSRKKTLIAVLAVAASLLILCSVPILLNEMNKSRLNPGLSMDKPDTESTDEDQASALANQAAEIEQRIHALKMNQLRSRLHALKSEQHQLSDPNEVNSIVEVVSGQTPNLLFGDTRTTREKMALIIEEFPGTTGAELAQQFLAEN